MTRIRFSAIADMLQMQKKKEKDLAYTLLPLMYLKARQGRVKQAQSLLMSRDGRTSTNTCKGQSPARTLNRLDFPEPLGPMTMMLLPGGTSKVSSLTSFVPSGEFSATLRSKDIGQPLT